MFQLLLGPADGEVHQVTWIECMKIARENELASVAKTMLSRAVASRPHQEQG